MRTNSISIAWRVVLLLATCMVKMGPVRVSADGHTLASRPEKPAARPAVTLRAVYGATLPFMTQNGSTVDGVLAQAYDLPHLVLYRNGALTPAAERTLVVDVTGIQVPAAGVTVTLEIETQHRDPEFEGETGPRLSVWRASQRLVRAWYAPQRDVAAVFVHEFGTTVPAGTGSIATPTDYFRYTVTVTDDEHPASNPLYTLNRDYAFLMENQWIARLPEVSESSPGAAPDELVVYYCDMFPFRKDLANPRTWLPRQEITDYVGAGLLSSMVEAFRVQTDEWGFPWSDAWTSYRLQDPERLSVALVDGGTWFHGDAPIEGDASISINVSSQDNAGYDSLADALLSTFHHELLHNVQRNLNLSLDGDGRVGGKGDRWKFFSEGTAVLASSVMQPHVHLGPSSQARIYMAFANRYLVWGGGRFQDLIANHDQVDPYYAGLYWRFLYEQCGGMAIARRALEVLYGGEIVDIGRSSDLLGATPVVLDHALTGSSCPFQTYQESAIAFFRAIYGLRVEGGRCIESGVPAGCGFYDPHAMYADPPVHTLVFAGAPLEHRSELMSGSGADLIEVVLDSAADGLSLALDLHVTTGVEAELDVQIVPLVGGAGGPRPQVASAQKVALEIRPEMTPDGHLIYALPEIDLAASNRFAMIVTRLDGTETLGSTGEYRIVLRPAIG